MAIRLADLQKETRKIEVTVGGETLTVEYRVNVVTPAFLNSNPGVVEQLETALVSWDLLGEKGDEPLPITTDVLQTIPVSVLSLILEKITDDIRGPGSDEKKG